MIPLYNCISKHAGRRTRMLDKKQMQEIQDLKLCGYTKAEILTYYQEQGLKPPSRPTISKYYDMDVVPEDPGTGSLF